MTFHSIVESIVETDVHPKGINLNLIKIILLMKIIGSTRQFEISLVWLDTCEINKLFYLNFV